MITCKNAIILFVFTFALGCGHGILKKNALDNGSIVVNSGNYYGISGIVKDAVKIGNEYCIILQGKEFEISAKDIEEEKYENNGNLLFSYDLESFDNNVASQGRYECSDGVLTAYTPSIRKVYRACIRSSTSTQKGEIKGAIAHFNYYKERHQHVNGIVIGYRNTNNMGGIVSGINIIPAVVVFKPVLSSEDPLVFDFTYGDNRFTEAMKEIGSNIVPILFNTSKKALKSGL